MKVGGLVNIQIVRVKENEGAGGIQNALRS
jgi:hypothetical protein